MSNNEQNATPEQLHLTQRCIDIGAGLAEQVKRFNLTTEAIGKLSTRVKEIGEAIKAATNEEELARLNAELSTANMEGGDMVERLAESRGALTVYTRFAELFEAVSIKDPDSVGAVGISDFGFAALLMLADGFSRQRARQRANEEMATAGNPGEGQ